MNSKVRVLEAYKVVPVIQISSLEQVKPLAEQLIVNDLPVAEVTLRTKPALASLEVFAKEFPELLLIAGTVLNSQQARSASNAGASMIVSPGFNPQTISYCLNNDLDVIPGAMTPGEMEQALDLGLKTLKFFPAEAAGGIKMLKSVSAPYKDLRFMPTGGIHPANVNDYLALSSVICCGGSWMVDPKLMATHDWPEVGRLIRHARALTSNIAD
ncbi:putative KHG/KDPG aldolase [Pseudovibrio sp. W64]|uniref:bifunctional 4-hydroxy-2-oxoglutarate aldolase/2-dehydro-3-deoxy-phosphogluconate aldolase n=1 Tax=unclassified Pseudovibrio TaxID=2627060 RepID=UPI0007AEC43D|nr:MULTISPECIES: bifunctional 4-hydroxy-2-oxoglutarate aldolase/2-dehydro-3-deoxy-phosphogluconate aldolase [unclassified Pseudovibrio]KZK78144.1 putative KHG/KDPG aldolase [Pseudovibrio sp. W64]